MSAARGSANLRNKREPKWRRNSDLIIRDMAVYVSRTQDLQIKMCDVWMGGDKAACCTFPVGDAQRASHGEDE